MRKALTMMLVCLAVASWGHPNTALARAGKKKTSKKGPKPVPYKFVKKKRPPPPPPKPKRFGIGVTLSAGGYNGISARYVLNEQAFLQGVFSQSFLNGQLAGSADYVIVRRDLLRDMEGVQAYFGGGAVLAVANHMPSLLGTQDSGDSYLGARGVVGALLTLDKHPVHFFGQAEPGLLILPTVAPLLSLAIGARFLF